jgi:hypothetical protein
MWLWVARHPAKAVCLVLAAALVLVGVPAVGVAGFIAAGSADPGTTDGVAACGTVTVATKLPGVPAGFPNAEQQANITTIVNVGRAHRVPARGWVVALATAMQESSLTNLPGGDRDSVGLFQQRPSQGWGTAAQLADPAYAATAFYAALERIPGWESMPVTVAAQTVQRSALPGAYEKWETLATSLASGTDPAPCGITGPVPAGSAPELARRILAMWGDSITPTSTARITGSPGSLSDLRDTASGAGFDACGHHVLLDPDMLRLNLIILQQWKQRISDFDTGHACDGFYHPPGMATDVGMVIEISTGLSADFNPGSFADDPAVVGRYAAFIAAHGPTGLGMGQQGCPDHLSAGPVYDRVSFADSCTHQHFNVHQNEPQWGPYLPASWPAG